jgi:hypothetical protein
MLEEEMPAEDDGKNSDEFEVDTAADVLDRDGLGRFVVEEPEVAEVVEVVEDKPKAAQKPAKSQKPAKAASDNAVKVSVAALVYSPRKRNSLSVVALQDRLTELNYAGARSDFRGWYHDGTRRALQEWQKDSDLEVTGECSLLDAEFLFDGTEVELVN